MPFFDLVRRTLLRPPAVCAALAVVVRASTLATSWAANPLIRRPQLDGTYYLAWARAIAAGDLIGRDPIPLRDGQAYIVGGEPFFLNPLYAYVAAPFAFLGDGMLAGLLVLQVVLGGATAALVAVTAGRRYGAVGAWVAGLGVALSAVLVHLDAHLSVSGVAAFLTAGAAFAIAGAPGDEGASARGHGPIAAGLWLGLGAMARPVSLLAVPFALWWYTRGVERSRAVRSAALVLLAFGACVLPGTVRNRVVSGEWVPFTAASGANLFLGNNAAARKYATMESNGRFRFNPFEMHRDARRYYAEELGVDATWSEISSAFTADAVDEFVRQPGDSALFYANKARWFGSPTEVPSSASLDTDRTLNPVLWIAPLPTWLLVALGLAGLGLAWRRRELVCGPGALVLAHVGVLTIVFPLSHYRSPAIPALAVLAGGAVAYMVSNYRGRRRATAGALALTGVIAVGCSLPPQPAPLRHTSAMTLAYCHRDAGELDEADRYARHATELYTARHPDEPGIAAPWFLLGVTHYRRKLYPEAIEFYEQGLAREPRDFQERLQLAEAHRELHRPDRMLTEVERVFELEPVLWQHPHPRARLGEALVMLRRPEEAREHLIYALEHARTPRDRPRQWALEGAGLVR